MRHIIFVFFIVLLPGISHAVIDNDCLSNCKKNALGKEDCITLCTSSTNTISRTETNAQLSVEEIANHLKAEAFSFSLQAVEAKDDKVFLDRTIKAFESCKKIGDGEAGIEGECISNVTSNILPYGIDLKHWSRKVLENKTYKQKYSLAQKAIYAVYEFGDMRNYAEFCLCLPLGIYHDFQKAYNLLTTLSDNFDRSQLIKMYDNLVFSIPGGIPFPEGSYMSSPFWTSRTLLKFPVEVQQATTYGCKKCEDFVYKFDFNYCKELCVASYIIKGINKRGPDWQYLSDSNGSGHFEIMFFNASKIQRKSKSDVRVWMRSEPRIEKYEDIQSYEQLKDFSYSLYLYQIDCVNAEMKTLSFINYDSDGNILESYSSPPSSEREAIVPGSIGEKLFHVVCKKK